MNDFDSLFPNFANQCAEMNRVLLPVALGAVSYTFQNLMGVAVLGVWLIFSTIAAPVILQKAIATGSQIGSALAAGTATAGVAAATTGAGTAATIGAGGGAMSAQSREARHSPVLP